MEEEGTGQGPGVARIVHVVVGCARAGRPLPAAGVVTAGERMRGSPQDSLGDIHSSPLPSACSDQKARGPGLHRPITSLLPWASLFLSAKWASLALRPCTKSEERNLLLPRLRGAPWPGARLAATAAPKPCPPSGCLQHTSTRPWARQADEGDGSLCPQPPGSRSAPPSHSCSCLQCSPLCAPGYQALS